MVNTAVYYKQFGFVHGDIQPRTVHLNKDDEIVLMDNILLFPRNRDSLYKVLNNNAYRGALSPIQMQGFSLKMANVLHNKYASEIWSIGLTALAYAASGDVADFYDWNTKEVRHQLILAEIYRLFTSGYSKTLTNLFKHLLALDEKDRPSLAKISSCFVNQKIAISLEKDQPLSTIHIQAAESKEVTPLMYLPSY